MYSITAQHSCLTTSHESYPESRGEIEHLLPSGEWLNWVWPFMGAPLSVVTWPVIFWWPWSKGLDSFPEMGWDEGSGLGGVSEIELDPTCVHRTLGDARLIFGRGCGSDPGGNGECTGNGPATEPGEGRDVGIPPRLPSGIPFDPIGGSGPGGRMLSNPTKAGWCGEFSSNWPISGGGSPIPGGGGPGKNWGVWSHGGMTPGGRLWGPGFIWWGGIPGRGGMPSRGPSCNESKYIC